MIFYQNQQVYPYLFLIGNCLVWYGTSEIHETVFFTLFVVPPLLYWKYGRLLAVLFLGICFAELTTINQHKWQFPRQLITDNQLLIGSIEDLPQNNGNIVRLLFKVSNINHHQIDVSDNIYFRLSCYRNCPEFKADQKWQLLVRLKPVNGYMNPAGFDYEKWLYSEQIKATGYIVTSTRNKLLSTDSGINSLRQEIRNYFLKHLKDGAVRGSAIALTLGDKSYLQKKDQQLLAENGLSHLLAISGLHIGLSAIPGFFIAGFLWRRVRIFQQFNRIQFQWFACVIPASCYAAFSGFGLPAQRALIMLLVFSLLQLWRNSSSSHSRFVLALWLILLTQPFAVLQISFWLSFCATAILIFLSKLLHSDNPVLSLIKLQTQLFIMLLPIQLLIFGSVSLISPVLNFVAIPFVSILLLPLLLLQVILILLSAPGADYLLWVIEQLLTLFWLLLSTVEPYSDYLQLSVFRQNSWHVLLYPLFILLLVSVHLRVKLVTVAILILLQLQAEPKDQFRMLVLDVGQGLAISIDYQDKLLIYDTAYGSADFSTADMTLIPWLDAISARTVDLLIVGHNDADHAGGLSVLMDNRPVNKLITGTDVIIPADVKHKPVSTEYCYQGQYWQWQQLFIDVLSPKHDVNKLKSGNDNSCVLLLQIHNIRILLTGDIETAAEQQLLQNNPDLSANILLVPHHGSTTSSGVSFIRQINPDIAIISSGYLNRFNHPDDKIIKRFEKYAVKVYNTAYSGAVEVTINNHGDIGIKQWRLDSPTLWRR